MGEGQPRRIEVVESYRQLEGGRKFCLLSTVLITMARRKRVLWNHYAPVKLNKGKVFPHEGRMRTWERSCSRMRKSWRCFSAVWPWCLNQILRLQIYKYMISPSLPPPSVCLSPPHLYLSCRLPLSIAARGKPQGLSAASSLKGFIPPPRWSRIAIWTLFTQKCCPGNIVYFYYHLGGGRKTNKYAELVCTRCFL